MPEHDHYKMIDLGEKTSEMDPKIDGERKIHYPTLWIRDIPEFKDIEVGKEIQVSATVVLTSREEREDKDKKKLDVHLEVRKIGLKKNNPRHQSSHLKAVKHKMDLR